MVSSIPSIRQRLADRIDPPDHPYLKNPAGWIRDVLDEEMWSSQELIANLVIEHRKVAVQAAHGVGKSWLMARLIAWWLAVHPVGEAFVVTTAPTDDQVKAVLWRELGVAHRKADLAGRITLDAKWHIGQELVAYGRKPADYNPDAFQGVHATYVLVILDEACGIPFALWDAAGSLGSNVGSRMIAVGNPTDPSSHFAKVCKPGSTWERVKISIFDSPIYTGEVVSERLLAKLTSKEWVEEKQKEYGLTSPLYCARVLGEFPDISDDTLIHPRWIREAQERFIERNHEPHLGVDIARMGSDETVIMRREGGWARVHWTGHKLDTMRTTGEIVRAINEINGEPDIRSLVQVAVDEVGVGAGVLDRLNELGHEAVGLNGGRSPIDSAHYINARSEWYWAIRKMFEQGEIDIDPDDDRLAAQLGAIKTKPNSPGQNVVETKEDMRKRNLPSPDRADALCYAFVDQGFTFRSESHHGETIMGDVMTKVW